MLSEERVKICPRCKTGQPLSNFHKCKKNGVKGYCKKCSHELNKKYRENNPESYERTKKLIKSYKENMSPEEREREKIKRRSRKRGLPLEVILEEERISALAKSQNKKYCYGCKNILDKECFGKLKQASDGLNTTCRECRKITVKEYYRNNSERMNSNKKEYNKKNWEKVLSRQQNYIKKRRDEDEMFRLCFNLRSRLRSFLSIKNLRRRKDMERYDAIGCSPSELKLHIENLFVEGMSWENYGFRGWHIDHIIPLSSAKTYEEAIKLNHYTNLQPLWAIDNLKKGKKIIK